jgi:hypothetical protein
MPVVLLSGGLNSSTADALAIADGYKVIVSCSFPSLKFFLHLFLKAPPLPPESHEVGKRNTQRIEQKHLRLRTRIKRLARKTICFSRSELMHDLVIGLFINRQQLPPAQ